MMFLHNKSAVLKALVASAFCANHASAAIMAAARSQVHDRTLRRGNGGKGKGSKEEEPQAPDLCQLCPGAESYLGGPGKGGKGGRGGGGRRGNGKSGKSSSGGGCDAQEDTTQLVTCGSTFMGAVTLTDSLQCDVDETPDFCCDDAAITMDGPNAVLDCGGNHIMHNPDEDPDSTVGIRLLNGATAINCFVSGFDVNVVMMDGDNSLLDSYVSLGDSNNIYAEGMGCMTVAGTASGKARDDDGPGNGLQIESTGTFIVIDSAFIGNDNDGIRTVSDSLCLSINGVEALHNEDDGIDIDGIVGSVDIKNSRTVGNNGQGINIDYSGVTNVVLEDIVSIMNESEGIDMDNDDFFDGNSVLTVGFYGSIIAEANGDEGINISGGIGGTNAATVTFFGTFLGNANVDQGVDIQGASVLFAEGSYTEACGGDINSTPNVAIDFDELIGLVKDGTVVCDSTEQDPDDTVGFTFCDAFCPASPGTANACVE